MKHLYFHPKMGIVMVKQGFSWPAAIFGSLWAMVHRMWLPYVLVLLLIESLIWFLASYIQVQPNNPILLLVAAANLTLVFVRGRYGNAWLAAWLRRHGYAERDDLLPVSMNQGQVSFPSRHVLALRIPGRVPHLAVCGK